MVQPAFVLGEGLVTCLGDGVAAHAEALAAGMPGPTRIPAGDRVPATPCHLAAETVLAPATGSGRLTALLDRVVAQALAGAQLPADAIGRMALLAGSSCLDLPWHEDSYVARTVHPRAPALGAIATHVAQRFGIAGPVCSFNTACSSSANALLYARLMLDAGKAEHVLVIGVEAYNRLSVAGFGSLMLLSRQTYRPFDRERDGLVLGEGAGALVLSRTPHAADTHPVSLSGAASAGDPTSPTGAMPERIAQVMTAALDDAATPVARLTAIKAHGTGTGGNDLAEGQAMRMLDTALPPFTSLKPYVGHTLGGCGVIESLLLLAAWRQGFLPATPGFAIVDPEIGLAPVTAAQPLPAEGAVLCNFFGFGGNNTSLVWRRA